MNLLYITPLWSGLKPFFLEGKNTAKGMPAFFKVFQALLNKKEVDKIYILLFIYNDKSKVKIPTEYSSKIYVYPFYIRGRISLYIKLILSVLIGSYVVISNQIKLIYGHGTISFIASIIGNLLKVKNYRRIYGTFLYRKVLNNEKIFYTNFLEYLSFKLKANGVIITNDGTHGDKVFNKINKNNNNKLHFLLNGVDKNNLIDESDNVKERMIFSYVARIDRWKRQHLLIEALGKLKLLNVKIPETYVIGHIFDNAYLKELNSKIKEYNLQNKVKITGPLNFNEVKSYYKKSIVTFSLYDFSNLGNVFIESLSNGVPMVAINEEESLNYFPNNTYIPVTSDPDNIAIIIREILEHQIDLKLISLSAKSFSEENILSWEKRVNKEIEILFDEA